MGWIFDSSVFLTRGHCGLWEPWLILTYRCANFTIAISYFVIAGVLIKYWLQHRTIFRDLQAPILFAIFILSCGVGHLLAFNSFSWAPYRFFAVVDVITAIASCAAMVRLKPIARSFANLLAASEYKKTLAKLQEQQRVQQDAHDNVVRRNLELLGRIEKLESEVNTTQWVAAREETVHKLRGMINTIVSKGEAEEMPTYNSYSGRLRIRRSP